jgi:L-asparaginase
MPQSKILLISLGGTITMTRDASGAISPSLSAADLVRAVPGIESVAGIETASPMRLPGASLTIDNLLEVAALLDARLAGDIAGAVVIQGTDTIEETAFVLDLLVKSDKPVVVTGAMRGAEAPGADGPANVLSAVIVAADPRAAGRGCLVVLNDEIHAARFVQKAHTALPSAFVSPLAGPLGLVIEGAAVFYLDVVRLRPLEVEGSAQDQPVALVGMALGDDGRILPALADLGYRGAVLSAMGAGHVPAIVAPLVSDLVPVMPVVLASRVHTGPVFSKTYGFPGSETDLLQRGVLSAGRLSPLKARLLLSLLLRQTAERAQLEKLFRYYAGPQSSALPTRAPAASAISSSARSATS